jgi:hypothetical protein
MNRTSSPEASTWSYVASIRRRAPPQRADEVSLEEFKVARTEFKAKIRRYAPARSLF